MPPSEFAKYVAAVLRLRLYQSGLCRTRVHLLREREEKDPEVISAVSQQCAWSK